MTTQLSLIADYSLWIINTTIMIESHMHIIIFMKASMKNITFERINNWIDKAYLRQI